MHRGDTAGGWCRKDGETVINQKTSKSKHSARAPSEPIRLLAFRRVMLFIESIRWNCTAVLRPAVAEHAFVGRGFAPRVRDGLVIEALEAPLQVSDAKLSVSDERDRCLLCRRNVVSLCGLREHDAKHFRWSLMRSSALEYRLPISSHDSLAGQFCIAPIVLGRFVPILKSKSV